jgi:uncharacterized membrane protein
MQHTHTDRLIGEFQELFGVVGRRVVSSVTDRVSAATDRLTDYADGGGGPGLVAAVTGAKGLAEGKSPVRSAMSAGVSGAVDKLKRAVGGGGEAVDGKLKVTTIVEEIDVGVPVREAYNQWTRFADFPGFMKKVETVEQVSDEKLNWKAQILWSHRSWESTIVEQVPDERIVWRSKGRKGYVDGSVSFHELAPNLARILLVLEYHPQGLLERTGNIWRAQGRRARLELKHFQRHVMSHMALHPEQVEGWRGEIHDSRVVKDHDAAVDEQGRNHEPSDEPEDEDEE